MTPRSTSRRPGTEPRDFGSVLRRIREARERLTAQRSVLIAISGIDASGKGWFASRLRDGLERRGARVVEIHGDDWLTPHFRTYRAGQRPRDFYDRAVDFERMFEEHVLPLRGNRGIRLEAPPGGAPPRGRRPRGTRGPAGRDIILLEGIFLLKKRWRSVYDLAVWVDCTFETALERALSRRQENLSSAATLAAYRNLYFPAQELHMSIDLPRAAASMVIRNDPRLAVSGAAWPRSRIGPL